MATALDRLLDPLRSSPAAHRLIGINRDGDATETWSNAELLERSATWGARLRAAGLHRGDRVAVLTPSRPTAVALMLGVYRAGLCYVPINPRYRGAELAHVVTDCDASLLLCDRSLADERLDALPSSLRTLGLEASASSDFPALPDVDGSTLDPREALSDDETALLVYTSGTTGRSKGVRHSLATVVGNIGALTTLWRWSAEDVLSLALPLFHVHGLCIGIHGALMHGMGIRLHARFDPAAIVEDVRQGTTVFMGVPTMYDRLLDHLDAHPEHGAVLAQGRLYTAGSAALRPALLERWEAHTGHRILERYGMSETLITLSNPHDEERRPGSVGHPVPGGQVRIVDEHGTDVAPGQMGELWVRAPWMMQGYWGQPQATESAFTDGWFRTGDVVAADPDGYLRIVGRRSTDIIKSGGFKIAAPEIERVLLEHPDVKEAAVVGIPDDRWGERIAAVIVPAAGATPTLEVLSAWVSQHLADYKKPRQLEAWDALPRNALGKLQKPRIVAVLQSREPDGS